MILRPPHLRGVYYNGARVRGPIEVEARDVEALIAEGWSELGAADTNTTTDDDGDEAIESEVDQ